MEKYDVDLEAAIALERLEQSASNNYLSDILIITSDMRRVATNMKAIMHANHLRDKTQLSSKAITLAAITLATAEIEIQCAVSDYIPDWALYRAREAYAYLLLRTYYHALNGGYRDEDIKKALKLK